VGLFLVSGSFFVFVFGLFIVCLCMFLICLVLLGSSVYLGLVSFGLVCFIVIRIGSSICLCIVCLVQFGLILIRLVVRRVKIVPTDWFVCLVGQVLIICLFGESSAHTLLVW